MAQPILRSAGIVSAAVFLSRITGVIRETLMARLFGAGQVYDAFLMGMRIPNLARDLFAEGALSAAFVPVFTRYLSTKSKREAAHLSNLVATALILAVGALCVVGIVFTPELVRLVAPGFGRVPGKFDLAVLLTRIMFPFLLLVSLAAQAMGLLNASDRYGVPALASTFFNIGSIGFGVAIGFTLGRSFEQGLIVSMAIGVVAGGVLQLAWQLPSLYRAGFAYRPRFDSSHPGLREILRLMLPAVLGNAALQINAIVNTNIASNITDASGHVINGPVSWLGYAFRFLQLPLGIFGVAIASASLPAISRSAAAARSDDFRDTIAQALGMILLLTIPSSVGLAVLGDSMIGTIYQWGHFGPGDTEQTAHALAGFSLGLAGYAGIKVLAPAFYALGDSRTPMWISLGSIGINYVCANVLVRWAGLGHAGLALSTSLVALFGMAVLFLLLSRRAGGLHGGRLAGTGIRIALASGVMGVTCWFSSSGIQSLGGPVKLLQLTDVAISIPLGAAVFYGAAHALRVREVEALRNACYTFFSNASRSHSSDSPSGD